MEISAITVRTGERAPSSRLHHSNVSFCKHVGWDGILVLFFMSIIAGLFLFLTYQYTHFHNIFQRDFVWVFLLMSGVYCFKIISRLIRWSSEVHGLIDEEFGTTQNESDSKSLYVKLKSAKDERQKPLTKH